MEWVTVFRRGISWAELEAEQDQCVADVEKTSAKAYFLVSEPSATFTYGRSATPKDLLWPAETLSQRQVEIYPVSRGGKWTFHGPGQIVLYPIVRLTDVGYSSREVRLFCETLRQAVVATLREWGVSCQPGEYPFGVYIGQKKVASFGVAISHGICTHGLALYLREQPFFSGINPCGQPEVNVTSIEESGAVPHWEEASGQLIEHIKFSFKRVN